LTNGSPASLTTGQPGLGGSGSGGDLNLTGGTSPTSLAGRTCGPNGTLLSFPNQPGAPGIGAGIAGVNYGGGGTGAGTPSRTAYVGGAGAAGVIIVEEFY
jgi:hypothetical protein